MKTKSILVTAISMVFSLLLNAPAIAADYTLKLHHLLPPKAPAHTKMLEPWAQKIEAASNGRVKIEIYPAMSLGGNPLN